MQPLRRLQQQQRGLSAAVEHEGQLEAELGLCEQALEPRLTVLVEESDLGGCQQVLGGHEISGNVFGFGRDQHPLGPQGRIGGQRDRPLPKRRRRGHPAAARRAIG